ncbi:MAG: hypothetical protein C4320_00930 [Armatimonadota bacterium]
MRLSEDVPRSSFRKIGTSFVRWFINHRTVGVLILLNGIVALGWLSVWGRNWWLEGELRRQQGREAIHLYQITGGLTKSSAEQVHEIAARTRATKRIDDKDLEYLLHQLSQPRRGGYDMVHGLALLSPILEAKTLLVSQRQRLVPTLQEFVAVTPSSRFDAHVRLAIHLILKHGDEKAKSDLAQQRARSTGYRRQTFDLAYERMNKS